MSWDYRRYLELCSVLTSRSEEPNYEEIVEELMVMLKIKAINKTDELYEKDITEEQYHQIMYNIELIFANKLSPTPPPSLHKIDNPFIEDSFLEHSFLGDLFLGDDKKNINYIGFINIILLQCILAFTERYSEYGTFIERDNDFGIYYNCLGLGLDDTESDTGSDTGSDIEPWTDSLRLTKYIKKNKYSVFSDIFLSLLQHGGKAYTLENIRDLSMPIFLVRWNEKFSSDEIVTGFFLNIHYGEIVATERWADGQLMNPFTLLHHDLIHFADYRCMDEKHYKFRMNEFFDFYENCRKTLPKKEFRKIRLYMFLAMHEGEGYCYLDPNEFDGGKTFTQTLIEVHDEYMSRYIDDGDLLEIIPTNILRVPDGAPELTETQKTEIITHYIRDCIIFYKEKYDEWKAKLGGYSKRRVKKFKGKKTRKGKRHLGKA